MDNIINRRVTDRRTDEWAGYFTKSLEYIQLFM